MGNINGMARTEDLSAPRYNLKAVVRETGLNPSTIRAWERRYGMPQPRRTEGGHRQYSQRDIETLKWLIARQEEGMTISHAAQLWESLNKRAGRTMDSAQTAQAVRPFAPQAESEVGKLREAWIDACLAFDRVAAEQILARSFALFPPEVVTTQVLQAGLSAIGSRWYQGEVSIQQEHFASAMAVQRLEILIAATPPPTRRERIIIASAEDDYHVFSPLLFTFLLRRRGWDVLYLGADMPSASLIETVREVRPDMLLISAQTLSTATSLLEVAVALADSDTLIGYGGLIFNMMPQLQQRIPAHYLGQTVSQAVPTVERLLREHSPNPGHSPDHFCNQALAQFKQRRYLIESQIWRHYASSGQATDKLAEINQEVGGIIIAALIFGDSDIFSHDMEWGEYLMNSYRLSAAEVQSYLETYYEAARSQLHGPGEMITAWLSHLISPAVSEAEMPVTAQTAL